MTNHKQPLKIPQKVGLKEIAERCDLSVMSVSRALKGAKGVGPQTRARVLKVARELGYVPNRAASILASRQTSTSTIGIIIPVFGHTIFPEVVEGVESQLSDQGYQLFLCKTDDDPEKELREVLAMLERRVDGIVMAPASLKASGESVNRILQQGVPLVFIDRLLPTANVDAVIFDDYKGAYDAVSHLISTGCRRIACLSGSEDIWTIHERVRGFREAMKDNGRPVDNSDIIVTGLTHLDGELGMERVLARGNTYDGVFCVGARVTLGAIRATNARDIKIPEEMAIAGFSDVLEAEMLKVPLTTVGQDAEKLGRLAGQILVEKLRRLPEVAEADSPQRISIPTRLIVRASTR